MSVYHDEETLHRRTENSPELLPLEIILNDQKKSVGYSTTYMMIEKWNHLDLFSGIGGFALAADMAGWKFEHSLYSDIDEFANKVYAKNFPDAVPLGDIKSINGRKLREQYGGKWLLTGGWPCQDISCGNQNAKGLSGDRSGLFFEVLRILHELQPEKVLLENVEAVRRHGLEFAVRSISSVGYVCEWTVCPARFVGSPHLRNRMWIVAYPHQDVWNDKGQLSAGETDLGDLHQLARSSVCNRVRIKGERSLPLWSESLRPSALCRMDNGICEGLDEGLEARVNELDEYSKKEINERVGACGNAIVPQVAQLFLEEMKPVT